MLIVPAVDIRNGQAVRLTRGDPEQAVVYSSDPVEAARLWVEKGAARIHVVDLDGAFAGRPKHLDLAGRIKKEIPCVLEYGGGLRDQAAVESALELGIDKLILGTSAVLGAGWVGKSIAGSPERFMVSLDARDGKVAVAGWREGTDLTVGEAVKRMEAAGFGEVVYTDISRDGTLEGPNTDSIRDVTSSTKMKVFASGGVSCIEDVRKLKAIPGLAGVIIGKALYSGAVTLEECLAL
ncbi:MAG: 1-(5-phosphoribosyl)-5-[(5-phosphoribosylamino)methylideneamino]imidazole-4-carboxamide isomerase [Elusimicrobia bacterium RIFCSPLOWO2_01_FULL_64_13]|nr:MAG: 1-(5-phosphoribosyl)-5-[(5-phosphoribosylamino)methylideneamino]imidazole-4-carboxamide isomerase [Elusimicrobia bacterium RIFCSPHIGHO2_01_FULL_64_10]OGR96467.1 MAG: 1-(5-phosphoribosyl)-5-[(5-phosphoribosylamino)methylideneamino]imidazole-4-carboxamide isomerase [Elusimicrobia bacterium RIFCSPLOWO2_01_FULL_64_13]